MALAPGATLPEPICIECANCSPLLCKWLKDNDMSDIIDYESRPQSNNEGKKYELISIQKCKNYEKGPLNISKIKEYKMASGM